jgi:hypothetical protein
MFCRHVMLRYVMLCCVILCCVVLCYIMLCCVVLYYVVLCCVVLCYIMLCCVVLCYIMLCCVVVLCLLNCVKGTIQVDRGPQTLSSGKPHVGQPCDDVRQFLVFDRYICYVVNFCEANRQLNCVCVCCERLAAAGSKRQHG